MKGAHYLLRRQRINSASEVPRFESYFYAGLGLGIQPRYKAAGAHRVKQDNAI